MNIVETPDIWIITAQERLSIRDIKDVSFVLSQKIEEDITTHGMEVAGPWIFRSFDLPRLALIYFSGKSAGLSKSQKATPDHSI